MTRHVEQEAGAREDAVVRGGMEPRRRRGGARRGVASAAAALWRSAWPLSFPFPFFRPKKKNKGGRSEEESVYPSRPPCDRKPSNRAAHGAQHGMTHKIGQQVNEQRASANDVFFGREIYK